MALNDLTTLQNAKTWIKIENATDDTLLARLISAASRMVLGELGRPSLLSAAATEIYSGVGSTRQMLRRWPVTAIGALAVDGVTIAQQTSPPAGAGWALEPWDGLPPGRPQFLDLFGYAFSRGRQNISVTYTAGYRTTNEAATVPGSSAYTVQTQLPWAADLGVTLANGTALVAVTGAPAAGQYSASNSTGVGVYTFNAAQAGAAVLLNYSYTPPDLENATIELVALRYKERQRIGQTSVSTGEQTIQFVKDAYTDSILEALAPYRAVVPLA